VGDGREGAHVLAWVVADGRRGGGQSRGRDERRRVGRLGKLQFLQWACCCVGASGGRRRAQAGTGGHRRVGARGVLVRYGRWEGAAVGIPVGVEECARVPGMCWVSWSGSWRVGAMGALGAPPRVACLPRA
jgi:hypothetical protein